MAIKTLYVKMQKLSMALKKFFATFPIIDAKELKNSSNEMTEKFKEWKNDIIFTMNDFSDSYIESKILFDDDICEVINKILEETLLASGSLLITIDVEANLWQDKDINLFLKDGTKKVFNLLPILEKKLEIKFKKILGTTVYNTDNI